MNSGQAPGERLEISEDPEQFPHVLSSSKDEHASVNLK